MAKQQTDLLTGALDLLMLEIPALGPPATTGTSPGDSRIISCKIT